jgi:hypothetical protein
MTDFCASGVVRSFGVDHRFTTDGVPVPLFRGKVSSSVIWIDDVPTPPAGFYPARRWGKSDAAAAYINARLDVLPTPPAADAYKMRGLGSRRRPRGLGGRA